MSLAVSGTPTTNQGNVNTLNMTVPSGAAIGSVLCIVACVSGSTTTPTASATGWAAATGITTTGATSQFRNVLLTKTCVSGDPGSTVTVSISAITKVAAACFALTGVDAAAILDAQTFAGYTTTGGTSGSTNHAAPSVSAVAASGGLIIAFDRAAGTAPADLIASSSFTWPAGFTQVTANRSGSGANAGDVAVAVALGGDVAAGASTGGGNVTYDKNNARSGVWTLTLKQAAGGATVNAVTATATAAAPAPTVSGSTGATVVAPVATATAVANRPHISDGTGTTPDFDVNFASGTAPSQFPTRIGDTYPTSSADPASGSSYGVLLTPNGSGFATLTKGAGVTPTGKPWASFLMRFRLETLPGAGAAYDNLFEIGNTVPTAPKGQFTVYWNSRTLYADFEVADAVSLGLTADTGVWHTFEARVNFGEAFYEAYVRIDNGTIQYISSPANKTPSVADPIWIGYPSGASNIDYTKSIGRIAYRNSNADPGFIATGAATVAAPVATATATALAPAVNSGVAVAPPTATATAAAPVPVVTGGATVAIATASASATAPAPSLAVGSTIAAVRATGTALAYAPVVTSGVTVAATAATATAAAPIPGVAAGATVVAVVATATASAPAPSVAAGGSATINAPTATANATAPAPSVTTGATVQATTAVATAMSPAPLITAGATVQALSATANAQALAALVTGGANVTVPTAVAMALAPTPTVAGHEGTPAVTPPERTYPIPAELRAIHVARETRVYPVPAATRTLEVSR